MKLPQFCLSLSFYVCAAAGTACGDTSNDSAVTLGITTEDDTGSSGSADATDTDNPSGESSSGGSGADGTSTATESGGDPQRPADGSVEAVAAFLAAETYLGTGWSAETTEPREASGPVSPHGRVRVYFNDTLLESQRAGNGTVGGTPHDPWSMAVKEFYDGDTRVGQAAMLRTDDGAGAPVWTYHCWGPATRCESQAENTEPDAPIHGENLEVACGGCHGGLVFTMFP